MADTGTTKLSAEARALAYAETELHVHTVHEDAKFAKDQLDKILTDLSEKRDELRALDDKVADVETNLVVFESGKHPEMSQAAMDRHLKIVYRNSEELADLRRKIMAVKSDIDGLECDREVQQANIKICSARMTELGGYFQYLAVIKLGSLRKQALKGADDASSVVPGW